MAELTVDRLLQNPLGQVAPPGERGDIVRISDGHATIYMDPSDYEMASQRQVWATLADARRAKFGARQSIPN